MTTGRRSSIGASGRALTLAALLASVIAGAAAQQQPPPPPAAPGPAGQAGPSRGGPRMPQPLTFEDHAGYEAIFDGSTLKGWDGDPRYWRVEGGAVVGQTTPENKLTENTFLIWRGGAPADFELKLEYRIDAANSGIQVRSVHLPAGTPSGRGTVAGSWVLKGYQADIDAANRYTGQIYEERGRGFLAMRGQFSYVPDGGGPAIFGSLQRAEKELQEIIKVGDWNQVRILARGNTIAEILNGHVTSVLVDDDTKTRSLKGLIGLQIHVGEPMKVEFRNIHLRQF